MEADKRLNAEKKRKQIDLIKDQMEIDLKVVLLLIKNFIVSIEP